MQLTLSFRVIGAGLTGSISSIPAGIDCSSTNGPCTATASFAVGTVVTLTVDGIGASALSAWQPAACAGDTCIITMNSAQTVSYMATGNNLVFVTSTGYAANLGGLAGAKALCQSAAASGGLPGSYVPWLATSAANPAATLGAARGWIRPDGLPFADTLGASDGGTTGLLNGQVYYPPEVDELGSIASSPNVWTGAFTGAADSTCGNWTSSDAGAGGVGVNYEGSTGWWQAAQGPCNSILGIYCFGTDLTTPVTITKQAGRVAFVTKGGFAPTGGLAAADELCASEAAAAGVPPAIAFLASNGASAASRFDLSGANWVRPDGLPLASSVAALLAGDFLAPPVLHADGTSPAPSLTWTGAPDPNTAGSMATTCNNWSSNAAGVSIPASGIGDSSDANGFWFSAFSGTYACDTSGVQVYCFVN